LRYLKNLVGAFLISVGGYIFGFNVAHGHPIRRPLRLCRLCLFLDNRPARTVALKSRPTKEGVVEILR
jgi:hypothetical protein